MSIYVVDKMSLFVCMCAYLTIVTVYYKYFYVQFISPKQNNFRKNVYELIVEL